MKVSGFSRVFPLLVLVCASLHAEVRANGWEHAAIPFPILIRALDFPNASTRARAAQSLGLRAQPEAVEPLLKRLKTPESDPRVRAEIYGALGHLGDPRAVEPLLACLAEEARQELRTTCVAALGSIAAPEALPHLLDVLEGAAPTPIRGAVIDALAGFTQPRATAALIEILDAEKDPQTRRRALRSLGRSRSPAAATPLIGALRASREPEEQITIVRALSELRAGQAAPELKALLARTEHEELRINITAALGAVRDGASCPTLVEMLEDDVVAVRYFAIKGLRELGNPAAAKPLSVLSLQLSKKLYGAGPADLEGNQAVLAEVGLQVTALGALAELDAPKALPAFLAAAGKFTVRRDSASGLRLAQAIYEQRRAALYGLGYTAAREAVPVLAEGLIDPDHRLRAVAVRSFGVLGFADNARLVRRSLRDEAAEVRWTAASVLGRLRDRHSVGALIDLLADDNAQVRKQVALSLGYLSAAEALAPLEKIASQDESVAVREAAAFSADVLRDGGVAATGRAWQAQRRERSSTPCAAG